MNKYDITHKDVTCIAADWENKKFILQYRGYTFSYTQKFDIVANADTDHIREVIDEFLFCFKTEAQATLFKILALCNEKTKDLDLNDKSEAASEAVIREYQAYSNIRTLILDRY